MIRRLLVVLTACVPCAHAAVTLPSIFSEHMVLQREAPIPVWGWAAPGEKVTVELAAQGAKSVTAGADGKWKVELPKSAAGGPFTLAVKGSNEIRIGDVLVGEVWLCSGQSNMEFTVGSSLNAEAEKAAATDPLIRQMLIPKRPEGQPVEKIEGGWVAAAPATVGNFTACGYFMARELRKALGVPVGLIHSSWGGTRIEPWTTIAGFRGVPALKEIAAQLDSLDPKSPTYQKKYSEHLERTEGWIKTARTNLAAGQPVEAPPELGIEATPLNKRKDPQQQPTTLYNGMIHGVVGYGMRGVIWYQGESNHAEGKLYTDKMRALIEGWRAAWGIGEFPFNFVQIAPYQYTEDLGILPKFWVAQSAALAIPKTGMVVTTDIGTLNDIHPKNKQEVGRRLALLALAKTYGKTELVCEGPTFKAATVEGAKIRVTFNNAVVLTTRDQKAPDWFEIIGEEGGWTKADALIAGSAILLSAPQVSKPLAARFAWSRDAEPNLVNEAGLPTAAFISGGPAYIDQFATKVPEAKAYQLVYSLDLENLGASVTYEIDQHSRITSPFDRVGYFIELQSEGRPLQYAWTSFDTVTTDLTKIGIPTYASGANFQLPIKNLNVVSNVPGLTNGSFPTGGNIEFWPYNYGPLNALKVPGADDLLFDFGDQISEGENGYGSMQVHNGSAKQTVFAINHFRMGNGADLGIGNSTGANRDWTFTQNGSTYTVKKLRVFVHPSRP